MIKADWICTKNKFQENCPVFMKRFKIERRVKSAVLYVSARGVYEAILNGSRVGNFIMAPGWTSYKNRIQIQKYDITDLLAEENVLTVQLAKGWYGLVGMQNFAIIAQIDLEYSNGTKQSIGTDETWYTSDSALNFCSIYDGIRYDARFIPEFKDTAMVSEENDTSVLVEQISEPVTEQNRIKPIEIITTPRGEVVLDFGQNLTGYLEINLIAKSGDFVSFSFGEILDNDGNFYNKNYRNAKCLYEYTCRDGLQSYKPNLTFYGFRYVRIDNFPQKPKPDNFTAIVVHSNLERTGYIETSDFMVNQLFHNVIWGQKSNFLDIPTDCPQRDERLGWTGDAQVFIKTASYNYNVNKFFEKWLGDMKLEQHPDGLVEFVVPKKWDGRCGAAWSDAVTICPWQLYLMYGNKNILEMMFEPMKKWVDYITATTQRKYLWFGAVQLGDWLELKCKYGEFKGESRDDLIASAFYAYSVSLVCKTGEILGKDVSPYYKLHKNIVTAFIKEFKNNFKTQTEHILALHFGLTDKPEFVAASLVNMIKKEGNIIQTGFVGTPYLLHVLSKFGYNRLAYELLLRKEYPSWLYPITKGATTMWEHWDGIKPNGELWPDKMNSFNHYAYGCVADWMYSVAGGINPVEDAPGFEKLYYAPVPDDRIDWFKVQLKTAKGTISSYWWHENGKVRYKLITPVPTIAFIEGKNYEIRLGEYIF